QREVWAAPDAAADVAIRFELGLAVEGRYLLDGWPIAGARVALVPAGIPFGRPFTMPLGLDQESVSAPLTREVETDAEGRFVLPKVAQGEYFLEALLPSGRVHRSEPFFLPSPGVARREATSDPSAAVSWDLGAIDVADGLVVSFEVTDRESRPLSGARVTGRQGTTPDDLKRYEAFTDADGRALLSGFSVDQAVHLGCRKPGYRSFRQDYPLLPVLVTCVLEPLAALGGEVIGIDGVPPAGAMVTLATIPEESGASASPAGAIDPLALDPLAVDPDGGFAFVDLIAGDYELTAAAPGFEVATQRLSVEPGQVLELEAIVLLYGRELEGRVVDGESQAPLDGVEIRALTPPGAAWATTDADGEFRLATRSEEALVLHLSREGYAGQEVTVTPGQLRSREPLLLAMHSGGRIRAVVWDEATDLPCQSCRLLVRTSGVTLQGATPRVKGQKVATLETDARGEALSDDLAPGVYEVFKPRITHLGSSVVEEETAASRTVRVRRGEISTVRFGEARRTVRVVFQPSAGASWTLSARTPRSMERYRPAADGSFAVRRRAGEPVDLYLHLYDPLAAAEIEVRQTTLASSFSASEVELPLPGGVLHGRLTSEEQPVGGVVVALRDVNAVHGWATAKTRPDGSFSFPNLPTQVYTVLIGRRTARVISVRAGQDIDLGTFDLTPGSY
ncbi:MAG: carboxypeptidase regulatory-like domain-containing protein, partial [Acidobacteriota bacterium]